MQTGNAPTDQVQPEIKPESPPPASSPEVDRIASQPPPPPPSPSKGKGKGKGCLFAILVALIAMIGLGGVALVVILAALLLRQDMSLSEMSFTNTRKVAFQQDFHSGDPFSKNKIAVIHVQGVIINGKESWHSIADADSICEQLIEASKDHNIKAVILYVDSPGGEITATDKIYYHIKKLRSAGKPVVALMDSMAASGGYYVSAATDHIIANRLTTTGSIGVIIGGLNYHELLGKIGLKDEVYKSKEMKDILNPARPRTEAERIIIQDLVDDSYGEFVKVVAEGRKKAGLTEELIRNSEIGDGRIFSGQQALELGLVDALGYFEDAESKAVELAQLQGLSHKVVTFQKSFSFLDVLSEFKGGDAKLKVELPMASKIAGLLERGHFYYLPDGWFF